MVLRLPGPLRGSGVIGGQSACVQLSGGLVLWLPRCGSQGKARRLKMLLLIPFSFYMCPIRQCNSAAPMGKIGDAWLLHCLSGVPFPECPVVSGRVGYLFQSGRDSGVPSPRRRRRRRRSHRPRLLRCRTANVYKEDGCILAASPAARFASPVSGPATKKGISEFDARVRRGIPSTAVLDDEHITLACAKHSQWPLLLAYRYWLPLSLVRVHPTRRRSCSAAGIGEQMCERERDRAPPLQLRGFCTVSES